MSYLKSITGLSPLIKRIAYLLSSNLTSSGVNNSLGMILLGFGIVQVGLSLKSHDPSQRANGFLTVAGGIVITFAKEILNMITG